MLAFTSKEYITKLKLRPHPEGGYFVEIYKSEDEVQPLHSRYGRTHRKAGTSIYYLLDDDDFSAWHRLRSDEIWHFYDGGLVKVHEINENGEWVTHLLGNPNRDSAALFQCIIKAGSWFAAELVDKKSFCLVGCTVSPGFEYADFELAERKKLIAQYPKHAKIIQELTREDT